MDRVLVVDDERQLTAALESALGRHGYAVTTANDGERGIELAATAQPDLMILDLSMPRLDGLAVIERVRPWFDAPILVLSGASQTRLKVRALDAGADDFLEKPFGLDELLARLRALSRRTASDDAASVPTVLAFPGLDLDLARRRSEVDGVEVRLTPTEWRLLIELVTHPDQLLTHPWLLQRVWDSRHGEETREALRSHVRTLRAKIGDDARQPRFIRTESGSGYRWIATTGGDRGPSELGSEAPVPTGWWPDPMHELANAVTALRVAAQLVTRARGEGVGIDSSVAYDRLDELSERVSRLVAEMSRGREDDEGREDF